METVRLDHPRDLLTAVPYLLGFHPGTGSLVAVALRRGRVTVTMRVEASDLNLFDVLGVWARLDRPLAEAGTDQVAVVGYLPPDAEEVLVTFAASAPVPVLDVLRVHEGRWWSLTCPNGPDCCPPGEVVVMDPEVVAPLVAEAGAPAATRADVAACLQPGPADLVDAVAALLPLDPHPPARELFAAVVDAHTERVEGPTPLPPGQAALLLQALSDLRIRDACCGWHDDAAWWLWTTLVRCAPPTHVAPVASLIATTAYQRGDTVLARMAADHALSVNPDYGLGQLVRGMVAAHINPALVREALAEALTEIAHLPAYQQLGMTVNEGGSTPQEGGGGHG